jgi:preprotein translocase SecE subunit
MYKIKRYFQGVWKQAKMVRWPSRKDLLGSVIIVLAVVVVAAIALSLSDALVGELLKMLEKQNGTPSSSEAEHVHAAIKLFSDLYL